MGARGRAQRAALLPWGWCAAGALAFLVLCPLAPFQHLHLGRRVIPQPMSPPVPAWAGNPGLVLLSTGAGPQQGGRARKRSKGHRWSKAGKGHKGRFRVGRCQRLPRLFSHPRQPRAHHRSGRAGAPRRERGQTEGTWSLGLRLPSPGTHGASPSALPVLPSDHTAKTGTS